MADGSPYEQAMSEAVRLGAEIRQGINWTWAIGFPTPEAGQTFVEWLDRHGLDNRGYYAAGDMKPDGVRFR